jgi:hypothetical protein
MLNRPNSATPDDKMPPESGKRTGGSIIGAGGAWAVFQPVIDGWALTRPGRGGRAAVARCGDRVARNGDHRYQADSRKARFGLFNSTLAADHPGKRASLEMKHNTAGKPSLILKIVRTVGDRRAQIFPLHHPPRKTRPNTEVQARP